MGQPNIYKRACRDQARQQQRPFVAACPSDNLKLKEAPKTCPGKPVRIKKFIDALAIKGSKLRDAVASLQFDIC